jgi:hypothetical protein
MTAPVTGRARRPLSSLTAPHRLTALVFATYAVPTALFGESIPANRGLGYDGTIYASIATRFGHLVRTGGLDSYDVWRALPSGAVWLIFRVFGVASTPQHLMLGFRWVNVIELIASIYVVHLIAQRLSFSVRAEWFVLLGMFGSFFALKWTLFDPVLVDCSGFFLAVVLLWAFLDERPIVLGAVTLLGAFTWPLVFVEGLVLLACPRSHRWGEPRPTDRVLAASLSVVAAAAAFVTLRTLDHDRGLSRALRAGLAPEWRSWAFVSALIAAAWVGLGLYPVARGLLRARAVRFEVRRIVIAAVVAVVTLIAHLVLTASPDQGLATLRAPTPAGFVVRQNLWTALGKPGIFVVSHVVFFGPVMLLTILVWPRVVDSMRPRGLALLVMAGMAVVLSLDAESRQLVDLMPLVVVFTAVAVQHRLRSSLVFVFGAATVAASKVWLPINHGRYPYPGTFFDFPAQYLFMNAGPYISSRSYAIQGSMVLAAGIALTVFLVGSRGGAPERSGTTDPVTLPAGGSHA